MGQIRLTAIVLLSLLVCTCIKCQAQEDSTVTAIQQLPAKYFKELDKKGEQYSNRLTGKTEKTLTKLSRWENKIHALLLKVNPETAKELFGDNQLTFTKALEKFKQGQAISEKYRAGFDEYRDKLTNNLKYLETQKEYLKISLIAPLNKTNKKINELDKEERRQQAMEAFIKERKKQLINEAVKYIGKSKYLIKINKESYYYVETIKNYKELFHDKKKAEATALTILNKIPAFTKFMQQNSMLARLFGTPSGTTGTPANLAGLQTQASVNALIQNQISTGGPNAMQAMRQNLDAAQAQLNSLKDKILKGGGNSSDNELLNFKPNEAKTKTFLQRLELGSNIQISKTNSLIPTTADLGISLGYKLNAKSVVGLGASYKMGLGTIQHISFTPQGIGLRSFADWKFKKQLFISGGYELNYNAAFKNFQQLQNYNDWQQSGLIGMTKRINVKTKFTKAAKLQLLYDMLARQHMPVSQPVIFRVGYNF